MLANYFPVSVAASIKHLPITLRKRNEAQPSYWVEEVTPATPQTPIALGELAYLWDALTFLMENDNIIFVILDAQNKPLAQLRLHEEFDHSKRQQLRARRPYRSVGTSLTPTPPPHSLPYLWELVLGVSGKLLTQYPVLRPGLQRLGLLPSPVQES